MQSALTTREPEALAIVGFVHKRGPFAQPGHAWRWVGEILGATRAPGSRLEVIGDFVIPPPEGGPSRDFQTLHFDFGLPLAPVVPADVARFTALHVPAETSPSHAVTRLVPLRALLAGQQWPARHELVRRFAAYGDSHGSWNMDDGYVEGSLARVIEAALDQAPVLPSVRIHPEFLCGTEFAGLSEEADFFAARGLDLDAVTIEVCLRPGDLLVFDNLALAHGRRGVRQPGELHQRVFGHRALAVGDQRELRDRMLTAFMTS